MSPALPTTAPPASVEIDSGPEVEPGELAREYRRARHFVIRRVLAATDALTLLLAAAVAFAISPIARGLDDLAWMLPTLLVWIPLLAIYGLYHNESKRINVGALDDLPRVAHALLVGTLLLWLYFRIVPVPQLVLAEVIVFGFVALAVMPLTRALARRAVRTRLGPERVLFLGDSRVIPAMLRKIGGHPEYGLEPVGLVVNHRPTVAAGRLPVLGELGDLDLPELVRAHSIERVIVSTEVSEEAMLRIMHDCRTLTVNFSLLPSHIEAIGPSAAIDDIEGVTVLGLHPLSLSRSSRAIKRTIDVAGAAVGLVLASPLMAVVALAVRLDSKGPILFGQERVGRAERRFRMLKFRTMVPDAEHRVDELLELSSDPNWLKLDRDPRITRVGRFLRLTSLDELPQLFNVLRGDMSLVGPRPLVARESDQVIGWPQTRLDLAPGITGLWQVLGRTNIPFEEMVKLDALYVANWSPWFDMKLILRTLEVVVSRRGAN